MGLGDTAQLAVQLNLTGNFDKGVAGAQKSLTGLDKASKSATKSIDQTATSGSKLGSKLSGVSKAAAGMKSSVLAGVGLAGGLVAFDLLAKGLGFIVGIAGEAQQAASDLGEQQSKLDQVFKGSAATIRAWAEDAATSLGLSERAALEATGTLGNFLQAMGTTEPVAADMSMSLVSLASDIASFNNVAGGAEEVLLAIQSGLAGETEPLRRFGVDISDVAIQARLLADGVQKVGGAFTQSQKIQARYNIIMDKTKKAQGDYARTAESSANQERTLAALRENALSDLGVYFDNIMKVGQALAITFVQGLDAAGEALHNLERFMFPHQALIEDTEQAIRQMAETRGIDAKAVIAYTQAQRVMLAQEAEVAATKARLVLVEETLADAQSGRRILAPLYIDDLKEEAESLRVLLGLSEEQAEVLLLSADARSAANLSIEQFLALSAEEQAELIAVGQQLEENTEKQAALTAAIAAAAERNKAYTASSQAARQGLEDLAGSVDYAKGSFKSFWKQLKEDQKQIKFLIRHPNLVENELDRIEKAIRKSEREKQRLLADGFQVSETLALKAMDDRIAALRAKQGAYLALGKLYGNVTESGMESTFDPRLVAYVDITSRGAGAAQGMFGPPIPKPPAREHGGTMQAWHTYQVNENGPEYLSMGGRGGWLSPAKGKGERNLHVTVQAAPITAYRIVEETSRTVSGNRRIAS